MGNIKSVIGMLILSVLAVVISVGSISSASADSFFDDDSSILIEEQIELPKGDLELPGLSWSYGNQTLTLTDFKMSTEDGTAFVFPDSSAVYIVLNGYNEITILNDDEAYGLMNENAGMQISGEGSLTLTVNAVNDAYGILANSVEFDKADSIGINVTSNTGNAYGIQSSIVSFSGSAAEISAGSPECNSYGIYGGFIAFYDSEISVMASGMNATYAVNSTYDISFNGGTADFIASSVSAAYGVSANMTITISNKANVNIETDGGYCYGMTATNIIENLGYVYSKGDDHAFKAYNEITAPNSRIVNANESSVSGVPSTLTELDKSKGVILENGTVSQITIAPESAKMRANTTMTLSVEYKSTVLAAFGVAWASSDDKIATIDEDGNVKGISSGTVTITATSKLDSSQTSEMKLIVGTATGKENLDLWVALVCGIAGCLAILFIVLYVHRKW